MPEYFKTGVKKPYKAMVFELDINNPPNPLILLLNPESLDIRGVPLMIENRVRWINRDDSAYIIQAHHDELDILSVSGKSALFYSNDGLTINERTSSYGWRNIQQLLAIYQNNGLNYNTKPGKSGASLIESVGKVLITYDDDMFKGSFENFNITEIQEKPFNLDFSFDFKVTGRMTNKQLSQKTMRQILI